MQNKRRTTTIAILGPFGWGNLGDAAIQDAVLAQIGSRRSDAHVVRIVGISLVPSDTRARHGIETYAYDTGAFARADLPDGGGTPDRTMPAGLSGRLRAFYRRGKHSLSWRFPRIWRILCEVGHTVYVGRILSKVHLLLISGGGQLDEFWGGPWHHPYTLFKWTVISRLTRTTVAFLSVGAGSIESPVSRWFLRRALNVARYRSYRDTGSKTMVREHLGRHFDDPVVPDMAFALPVSVAPERADGAKRLVVAVGPLPYCDPRIWPIRDMARYERYVGLLAEFCQSMSMMLADVTLRFFVGETRHDPRVIRDVVERLASRGEDRSNPRIDVPRIDTVKDLISCLSDADIVVASRFHGALLSLLLRRPVLALSYERKVRQLMIDLGQGEYCLDIERADVGDMMAKVAEIQAKSELIKRDLDPRVARERNSVLAQFDRVVTSLLPTSAEGA
jgi:polysaccharide pyruvyl transferase WcaK-like protein